MIPVTKPFLPRKEDYIKNLDGIWDRNWLTNNGPLVNEYELRLKEYFKVKHLLYVNNGTIALQIAIKALGLKGEIITTPFSYVATTSSIVWEGCQPVFVDIDPNTFNIDTALIEAAITERTSAILATHCFGNACDIDAIQAIADKNNLKVIYDAAHCFGTMYKGRSILEYGDISTLSLHATKPVHSVEGGLVVTTNPEVLKTMAYMRNFGHDGPESFSGVGINGKNSEFHAAMGLVVLDRAEEILQSRKSQSEYYTSLFSNTILGRQVIQEHCSFNYAYYPVLFKDEEQVLHIQGTLAKSEVFTRRYFFPLLSSLSYVKRSELKVAQGVAERVLCLPLYFGLSEEEQDLIVRRIKRELNYV